LGMSGGTTRPGPYFYINKVDNTINHVGEPCFSKVIIGRDVVESVSKLKGSSDDPFYIQPVDIKSARVLQDLGEAVGGEAYRAHMIASEQKQKDESL
jgi:hypothetical protein